MKLTDQIKEMIENAKSEEEVKTILENVKEGAENAGLILDDEDLDRASGGGRIPAEEVIDLYFEKENIHTLDAKGELLITIMSSMAQEESRSISENSTWGIRKRMRDGKFSLAYSRFLGYDKGPDGKLVINEEQAKVVRRIYSEYISGKW